MVSILSCMQGLCLAAVELRTCVYCSIYKQTYKWQWTSDLGSRSYEVLGTKMLLIGLHGADNGETQSLLPSKSGISSLILYERPQSASNTGLILMTRCPMLYPHNSHTARKGALNFQTKSKTLLSINKFSECLNEQIKFWWKAICWVNKLKQVCSRQLKMKVNLFDRLAWIQWGLKLDCSLKYNYLLTYVP